MKTKILILLTIFVALAPVVLRAQSSADEEMIAPGTIDFQGVDVAQVLDVYAKLVNRTVLRAALPAAQVILKTQTPLTRSEAVQALQAVLALNGIAVINIGDKFVKALPVDQANSAGADFSDQSAANLPALGSYVTHIVQLHYVKPSEMIPIIQPFAKLANSILAIDSNGILVLRDNAENVKRMLQMIDQVDINVPAEYISEVIPIRYAQAEDIASALNSLGGSGGSTVSIGSSSSSGPISGFTGSRTTTSGTGLGGGTSINGNNSVGGAASYANRTTGSATPNGTPATGTTFQQRLQSIINRASGAGGQPDQIQVFGQAKIIADSRANSLLVFATRQDMVAIKDVVSKLDVLLSQVLIEAIIMDVSIGHQFTFGVSAAQNPRNFGSNIIGGGGINNGQSFLGFLNAVTSTTTNNIPAPGGTNIIQQIINTMTSPSYSIGTNAGSSFANSLGSGFSYFGNIGPSWDIALQALQADSTATVIQRPRIQTSQAKAATFFVGETLPYITSTYNNGSYGNSSSYSQLNVGVELDVTPYINPDGLVVMDINQEIDDVSGFTTIDGNQVPNTTKRTLQSEINVRNRDTIILGGFIKSQKSNNKQGVPFLSDIPIIGYLFTQHTDQKNREELLVMMRPTVLKTPDVAAAQTLVEERRLPGVSAAASDDAAYERELIEKQRKAEQKRAAEKGEEDGGFYNTTTNEANYPFDLPSINGGPTNVVPATVLPPAENGGKVMQTNETLVPLVPRPPQTSVSTNAADSSRKAVEDKMNELDSLPTK